MKNINLKPFAAFIILSFAVMFLACNTPQNTNMNTSNISTSINNGNQNAPSLNQINTSKTGIPECDDAFAYYDELEKRGKNFSPFVEVGREQTQWIVQDEKMTPTEKGKACKAKADFFKNMDKKAK